MPHYSSLMVPITHIILLIMNFIFFLFTSLVSYSRDTGSLEKIVKAGK